MQKNLQLPIKGASLEMASSGNTQIWSEGKGEGKRDKRRRESVHQYSVSRLGRAGNWRALCSVFHYGGSRVLRWVELSHDSKWNCGAKISVSSTGSLQMPVCRRLVEMMMAAVWSRSRFRLPLQVVSAARSALSIWFQTACREQWVSGEE